MEKSRRDLRSLGRAFVWYAFRVPQLCCCISDGFNVLCSFTQDTGGYNLKTQGKKIETMKIDMAGAAAVFGCASIIGAIKPKHTEVHFIVAAAENMIDSKAYRPGDIVTAASGVTVEIGNTDAEGRLTLADALHYAETEIKPDAILDCATLTGACMVALGLKVGGVYSQDNDWMASVLNA